MTKYRTQILGVNGWVDGVLFTFRKDAEVKLEDYATQYGRPTRIVEVHA